MFAFLAALFTEHPRQAGETYVQHAGQALAISAKLLCASLAAGIHAVLPFLFSSTASTICAEVCASVARRQQHLRVDANVISWMGMPSVDDTLRHAN
jgi:hypothetical protein